MLQHRAALPHRYYTQLIATDDEADCGMINQANDNDFDELIEKVPSARCTRPPHAAYPLRHMLAPGSIAQSMARRAALCGGVVIVRHFRSRRFASCVVSAGAKEELQEATVDADESPSRSGRQVRRRALRERDGGEKAHAEVRGGAQQRAAHVQDQMGVQRHRQLPL